MFAAANAAPISSASSSTSTISSAIITLSALTNSTPTPQTTAVTGSSSSLSSPSATSSISSSSSSHTAAVVGAAVGTPLGLAALAGIFLFYRERKKRLSPETGVCDVKQGNDGSVSPSGASGVAMVSPQGYNEGIYGSQRGFESNTQPVTRATSYYELTRGTDS